jgi:hypothetical protein
MAKQPEIDEETPRDAGFPWSRAALLLVVLWASLWAAGFAGGRVGTYIFDERYVAAPPYTETELATLERVSPGTFEVASMDMAAWRDSVDMGRTIARLEGKVVGSLLLLAIWGSLGLVWLWNRQRERHTRLLFQGDFS